MRKPLLILLALVALLGAACGEDDPTVEGPTTTAAEPTDEPTDDPTDEPTETDEPCEDQTGDDQIELTMDDSEFDPTCLSVLASQTIHIVNQGEQVHSFTIDGTQVDIDVQPGDEFGGEGNAVSPGEYTFYCKYHGAPDGTGMAGTMTAA